MFPLCVFLQIVHIRGLQLAMKSLEEVSYKEIDQ